MAYFLQVNLCWLMFYGLYYVLLSKETFFKLNRIYLIISLLYGLTIPFFTERLSQMEEVSTLPIMEIAQPIAQSISIFQDNIETQIPATDTSWNLWLILRVLYILGTLWFLTQFVVGLFRIFKLYKNGVKEKKEGFILINTPEGINEGVKTPFSFFNWIFINAEITQNVDFQYIMLHEKAHVQQKHSFDIVGMEILRGLFWLSPLVHLYARSLRHVHEYLADAAVLHNTEKKQYGRLLINQTAAGSGLVLANHLNFSQLKKRIIMMTRNRSQRVALVKYTLAAPIFLILFILLASPKTQLLATAESVSQQMNAAVENFEFKKIVTPKIENQIISDTTRVLRDPYFTLGDIENGRKWMTSVQEFKRQTEIKLKLNEKEKGGSCVISSFELIHNISKSLSDPIVIQNKGQKFSSSVLAEIKLAKDGDYYLFKSIHCLCSGDEKPRPIGELHFSLGVEPIGEHQALFNGFHGGPISLENFKQAKIITFSEAKDQDGVNCNIEEFRVIRFPESQEPILLNIKGNGANNADFQNLIAAAKNGDLYRFSDIRLHYKKEGKLSGSKFLRNMTFYIGNVRPVYRSIDPIAVFSDMKGGSIGADKFKKYRIVQLLYEVDLEKPMPCQISGFKFVRVPADKSESEEIIVKGDGIDNVEMEKMILKASSGDKYMFLSIEGRCSNESKNRAVGSLSYLITDEK